MLRMDLRCHVVLTGGSGCWHVEPLTPGIDRCKTNCIKPNFLSPRRLYIDHLQHAPSHATRATPGLCIPKRLLCLSGQSLLNPESRPLFRHTGIPSKRRGLHVMYINKRIKYLLRSALSVQIITRRSAQLRRLPDQI